MQVRIKFVWLSLLVAASCAEEMKEQDEPRRTLCGRVLANARMVLCAAVKYENETEILPLIEAFSSIKTTGKPPNYVHTWPKGSSRKKREIATECCLKPCTVTELLSYC